MSELLWFISSTFRIVAALFLGMMVSVVRFSFRVIKRLTLFKTISLMKLFR